MSIESSPGTRVAHKVRILKYAQAVASLEWDVSAQGRILVSLIRGLGVFTIATVCLAFPAGAHQLSFDDRVRAQEAIERVYWSHQTGASEPFEKAVPRLRLEEKVRTYLRKNEALERIWATHVTGEMLEREMVRMAHGSQMPERLRELYEALKNDSFLVQECLARPILVDRLARNFFIHDERFHERGWTGVTNDPQPRRHEPSWDTWWRDTSDTFESWDVEPVALDAIELPEVIASPHIAGQSEAVDANRWQAAVDGAEGPDSDSWDSGSSVYMISEREFNTTVWTGSLLLIWGGESRASQGLDTGACYDPATDTWTPMSTLNAPVGRWRHSAVWTGSEMIVWGGFSLRSGGRYNPVTDTWQPTSVDGAPAGRTDASAVWTGSEMIIWGGNAWPSGLALADGARYSPATDTWLPTSLSNAPTPRYFHTAVWTGTRMIVWGGTTGQPYYDKLSSGGQYDPYTDTWTATMQAGGPSPRIRHTAIYTGSGMIVWGGDGYYANLEDTGGVYDPVADTWTLTSTVNAPSGRHAHTAVWAGTTMLIWGGSAVGDLDTGGRYDPQSDTWTPIATLNAPFARDEHTAVWTGSLMVVWGSHYLLTGGRYDPATDVWTPTSTGYGPTARSGHTAVWTGAAMILWGGDVPQPPDPGWKYDPATDTWSPISLANGPIDLTFQTAIWTGNLMVLWGGFEGSTSTNKGWRYDPLIDVWTSTSTVKAPMPRYAHTAVWSGKYMIVWGGLASTGLSALNTGARYDPERDTWRPLPKAGAPAARFSHTAVWTGKQMVVWGGQGSGFGFELTGGRYNPVKNSWQKLNRVGAPSARAAHVAIWTGAHMVVWGGRDGNAHWPDDAGRYDPVKNSWTPISANGAPASREGAAALWTGKWILVWGGFRNVLLDSGALFDPAANSWTSMSTVNAPSGRWHHSAVWTGSRAIFWGGTGGGRTGGRYTPPD